METTDGTNNGEVLLGTSGYEGFTIHMDINGDNQIDTSVTLTGWDYFRNEDFVLLG